MDAKKGILSIKGQNLCVRAQQMWHMLQNVFGWLSLTFGGLPSGSVVKNSPANTGDLGSITGSGRSSEEARGNPFQYSCLGNPKDRGDWWVIVHVVTKSQTWLSNTTKMKKLTLRVWLVFSHQSGYLLSHPGHLLFCAPSAGHLGNQPPAHTHTPAPPHTSGHLMPLIETHPPQSQSWLI